MALDYKPRALVGRDHPAIRAHARPVDTDDERAFASHLASRLYATVLRHEAPMICACQVGEPVSLVVGRDGNALCNALVVPHGETVYDLETCLTLPGRRYLVGRASSCSVTGMELDGSWRRFTVDGWLARAWQHKADHLRGVLISDL